MANKQHSDGFDRSLDPVFLIGGVSSLVIGIGMVLRGIITYIPEGGPLYGGLFTAVGAALAIAGIVLFTYPRRRDKKLEAAEEEQA